MLYGHDGQLQVFKWLPKFWVVGDGGDSDALLPDGIDDGSAGTLEGILEPLLHPVNVLRIGTALSPAGGLDLFDEEVRGG